MVFINLQKAFKLLLCVMALRKCKICFVFLVSLCITSLYLLEDSDASQLFLRPPYCSTSVCLVAQLCLTLHDPIDCSLTGSSVHGDSPCNNTRGGYHALLQGIFLSQGSNPHLLHCKHILFCTTRKTPSTFVTTSKD